MRIERAHGWPHVPLWATALVACQVGLVALAHALAHGDVVFCTFRRLTGYPCPGCGTTRMALAVLRGDLHGAVACNPLAFVACVAVMLLIGLRIFFSRHIVWITSRAASRYVTAALVAAVAANWVYLLVRHYQTGF